MNPWKVLEMEPSDDPRQIKRAYAKKLKQTRPDEKPVEFQALHQAYKRALLLAERQLEAQEQLVEPADPVVDATIDSTAEAVAVDTATVTVRQQEPIAETSPETENISRESEVISAPVANEIPPDAETSEVDEQYEIRLAAFRDALDQVDKVLKNSRFISVENSWHFLATIPYLLEDDFNRDMGFQVFKRIAEHNSRVKDYPLVTANILDYCDSLFGWQTRRWSYYREFGQALCNDVFNPLEQYSERGDPISALRGGAKLVKQKAKQVIEDVETWYFAGLFSRSLALLLDFFVIYTGLYLTVGVVMIKLMGRSEDEVNLLIISLTLVGYFIMAWIMESSPLQATLGKNLFGFKVTNRRFERVGYLHGFGRIISFVLSLSLTKFAWFINCFLSGNLIHDRLSRTYVIDIRKSRKQHNNEN